MMVSCAPNPRACGGTGGCEGATAQIGFGFVMNNALTYEETVSYSSFWGSSGECTDTSLGGCSAADFLEVAKEQKEQKEQGE
eukprot:g33200.t1